MAQKLPSNGSRKKGEIPNKKKGFCTETKGKGPAKKFRKLKQNQCNEPAIHEMYLISMNLQYVHEIEFTITHWILVDVN